MSAYMRHCLGSSSKIAPNLPPTRSFPMAPIPSRETHLMAAVAAAADAAAPATGTPFPTPTAWRSVDVTRVEHVQPVTCTGNCHSLASTKEQGVPGCHMPWGHSGTPCGSLKRATSVLSYNHNEQALQCYSTLLCKHNEPLKCSPESGVSPSAGILHPVVPSCFLHNSTEQFVQST